MLKFLTHKLRTHSLNEDNVFEKVEEHDSGTESDDEAPRPHGDYCTDVIMKWNEVTDINMSSAGAEESADCGCAAVAARLLPAPEPDLLYDHHSSEEELEVINGAPASGAVEPDRAATAGGESRRRGASSPPPAAPEKRKWVAHTPPRPYLDSDDPTARAPSSDDDDTKVETPVRFRTSPPLEALKPRRAGGLSAIGAASDLTACGCPAGTGGLANALNAVGAVGAASAVGRSRESPRRRRVALPPPRRHRPALDFDKMQQLRVGGGAGVRSWRAVGAAHGGELSVFCW